MLIFCITYTHAEMGLKSRPGEMPRARGEKYETVGNIVHTERNGWYKEMARDWHSGAAHSYYLSDILGAWERAAVYERPVL